MPRPLLVLAGVALAAAGCASGGSAPPDGRPADPAAAVAAADAGPASTGRTRNTNRNVLTRDELVSASSNSLLDVVTALRPRWLQNNRTGSIPARGAGGYMTAQGVAVYVNGQLFGDVKSLGTIETATVERLTYLSVSEAQQRYGTQVYAPVIEVRLRSNAP